MAATQTLSQTRAISQIPKHGVLTVFGYGIQVRVDRGHLFVEDGIGPGRRQFRLSRVRHGLRRLVVIGSDGMVSLAALRWLADQDAAFVMLERDGHVLATTGPVRSSDARLRRAQALAEHSGAALCIARELISRKLVGQERVARDILLDSTTADVIGRLQAELDKAETMDAIRWLESRGAAAYWSMWRDLPICFPKSDLHRVPDHWRAFDTRKSVLSGSQRLATNPVNAILNYVFSVVESESRLAAAALGLDPGLAFIHLDTPARDSLACDLMEPIRPEVEGWLLDWITREPLKREWFFEEPNGTCRLMAPLAIRLAETAPMWARAVAPVAEWVARHLWSRQRKSTYEALPPTRLTQRHKREAKGSSPQASLERAPQNQSVCHGCGKDIQYGRSHCARCAVPVQTERIIQAARMARDSAHSLEARTKRADTVRQRRKEQAAWAKSSQPGWLTEKFYVEKIRPALASVSNSTIASLLGVSRCHASQIRSGKRNAHPRHWLGLARLVDLSEGGPIE
jgi:CRISPR-associated endonuclease Cas1